MWVRMARFGLRRSIHARASDAEMARVGRVAQRIDDPDIKAFKKRDRRGQAGDVGRVGDGAEAEAERWDVAVHLRDGLNVEGAVLARNADLAAVGDAGRPQDGVVAGARLLLETIAEAAGEAVTGDRVEVAGHLALHGVGDHAQIVDAVRVVGVVVRVEDAIEVGDAGVEQLFAQVGGGVDEDVGEAARHDFFDENRAAARRFLGLAASQAPRWDQAGHAAGRAAAQDREADGHAAAPGRGTFW